MNWSYAANPMGGSEATRVHHQGGDRGFVPTATDSPYRDALRSSQPITAVELTGPLVHIAPLVSSARLHGYLAEIVALSARWRNVPEVKNMR